MIDRSSSPPPFGLVAPPSAVVIELAPTTEIPATDTGDEAEERLIHPRAVASRRRDFRRGRHAAHLALRGLERDEGPVLRGPHGEPIWPEGVVGSITHSGGYAVAVVAPASTTTGVGVDVELRSRFFPGLVAQVCFDTELARLDALPPDDRERATLEVFAAKEAIYKAMFAQVGRYFGFEAARIEPGPPGFLVARITATLGIDAPDSPLPIQVRWTADAVATLLVLPPPG